LGIFGVIGTMGTDEKKAQDAWISGGGVTIGQDAILLELKLGGEEEFLQGLLARKIAVALAIKTSVALSDDELDEAVSEFYGDRDIFEDAQIAGWLASKRLDAASVREYVCETTLVARAQNLLVTDDAIRDRFASDRYDYTAAEVEVFAFATAGAAKEFILAVREKEAEATGGEHREFIRRDAPEEIAAALFSCEPGDLAGPVENDDGAFEVLVMRRRIDAELDEELRIQIRGEMFRQLIEAELIRDPTRFLK
jgi:hypothetical protein